MPIHHDTHDNSQNNAQSQFGTLTIPEGVRIIYGEPAIKGKLKEGNGLRIYSNPPELKKEECGDEIIIDDSTSKRVIEVRHANNPNINEKRIIARELNVADNQEVKVLVRPLIFQDPNNPAQLIKKEHVLQVALYEAAKKDNEDPNREDLGHGINVTLLGYIYKDDVIREEKYVADNLAAIFPHEPSIDDICQAGMGDCFLLSTIGAILARNGADFIKGMMRQQDDGSVIVRLFNPITFEPEFVRVENAEHYHPNDESAVNHKARWVHILEKAYAGLGYQYFNEGKEYKYHRVIGDTDKKVGIVPASFLAAYGKGGNSDLSFKILTGEDSKKFTVDIEQRDENAKNPFSTVSRFLIYGNLMEPVYEYFYDQKNDDLTKANIAAVIKRMDTDKKDFKTKIEILLKGGTRFEERLKILKVEKEQLEKLLENPNQAQDPRLKMQIDHKNAEIIKLEKALEKRKQEKSILEDNLKKKLLDGDNEIKKIKKTQVDSLIASDAAIKKIMDEALDTIKNTPPIPKGSLQNALFIALDEEMDLLKQWGVYVNFIREFYPDTAYKTFKEICDPNINNEDNGPVLSEYVPKGSDDLKAMIAAIRELKPKPPELVMVQLEKYVTATRKVADQDVGNFSGPIGSGIYTDEEHRIFNQLEEHFNKGMMITAATPNKFIDRNVVGLVDTHAYTLEDVKREQVNGKMLLKVCLRNPWAKTGRAYNYNYLAHGQGCKVNFVVTDDGTVEIDIKDFMRYYESYTIGSLSDANKIAKKVEELPSVVKKKEQKELLPKQFELMSNADKQAYMRELSILKISSKQITETTVRQVLAQQNVHGLYDLMRELENTLAEDRKIINKKERSVQLHRQTMDRIRMTLQVLDEVRKQFNITMNSNTIESQEVKRKAAHIYSQSHKNTENAVTRFFTKINREIASVFAFGPSDIRKSKKIYENYRDYEESQYLLCDYAKLNFAEREIFAKQLLKQPRTVMSSILECQNINNGAIDILSAALKGKAGAEQALAYIRKLPKEPEVFRRSLDRYAGNNEQSGVIILATKYCQQHHGILFKYLEVETQNAQIDNNTLKIVYDSPDMYKLSVNIAGNEESIKLDAKTILKLATKQYIDEHQDVVIKKIVMPRNQPQNKQVEEAKPVERIRGFLRH